MEDKVRDICRGVLVYEDGKVVVHGQTLTMRQARNKMLDIVKDELVKLGEEMGLSKEFLDEFVTAETWTIPMLRAFKKV